MTEIVSVVACGWSVSLLDFNKLPGTIIGVNDSAIFLPRCDYILSMDRLWAEYRFLNILEMGMEAWLRRAAVKNLDVIGLPNIHVYDCDHTSVKMSLDPNILNGTNSGTCAVNKAFQLQPKEMYLFGFDMRPGPKGEKHWFKDYPWAGKKGGGTTMGKFQSWAREFAQISFQCERAGIKVINGSPRSLISVFPKTHEFELCTSR